MLRFNFLASTTEFVGSGISDEEEDEDELFYDAPDEPGASHEGTRVQAWFENKRGNRS